ncbi:hypothetical protein BV20DRAFT_974113 [Pilatotrama ljubarskyi]|nr:hypothetical protein BV20DRAFT_974113 [Pilatotrama ljubarskyi]
MLPTARPCRCQGVALARVNAVPSFDRPLSKFSSLLLMQRRVLCTRAVIALVTVPSLNRSKWTGRCAVYIVDPRRTLYGTHALALGGLFHCQFVARSPPSPRTRRIHPSEYGAVLPRVCITPQVVPFTSAFRPSRHLSQQSRKVCIQYRRSCAHRVQQLTDSTDAHPRSSLRAVWYVPVSPWTCADLDGTAAPLFYVVCVRRCQAQSA